MMQNVERHGALLTCVLCGVQYEAPAHTIGYHGLCPDHWSKDTLREWDRIESARRQVIKDAPQTLTLSEWLAIVASWRGLCAMCGEVPYSHLTIWIPASGLVAGNVAPLCRACHHHKAHSWRDALERVSAMIVQGGTV